MGDSLDRSKNKWPLSLSLLVRTPQINVIIIWEEEEEEEKEGEVLFFTGLVAQHYKPKREREREGKNP